MSQFYRPLVRLLFPSRVTIITLLLGVSLSVVLLAAVSASGPKENLRLHSALPNQGAEVRSSGLNSATEFVTGPAPATLCVNPGGTGGCFASIQGAVNAASSGDTIDVATGTYTENVTITKALTINGAGEATVFLRPALSAPNTCAGASLCPGGSNLILVQAANVTITGLTLDGDNPLLTSGVVRDGADLDARNGIITDHTLGVFTNLTVHHATIKNLYLRGIYASTGGTFNFHHDTVQNVQGEGASIGMFNFGGSGQFDNNNVSACNDAISSNHSRGVQFTNNTVTTSASGIHTDNAGDSGGSTPDTISNNTVTNSQLFGYGIWTFVPTLSVTVSNNTVTNVDVGLAASGGASPTAVSTFTDNTVDGQNKANSTGVYLTTDQFGFGQGNNSVVFRRNTVKNNVDGFFIEANAGFTLTANADFNRVVNNSSTALSKGGTGTFTGSFENNWWGCNLGPGMPGCGTVDPIADSNPWLVLGVSASPSSIFPAGNSTITADMTKNSAAATPAGGPVPQMPVAWSATEGTMASPTGTITAGQAMSTYTSTSSNNGMACATVDNQLTCTNVTKLPTTVPITPAGGSATAGDNDYTRINNAIQAALAGQTIKLTGTFNWTEANAALSWSKGSDGVAANGDDYSIVPPANLNNVILTADALGDASIQGPADLAAVNLEGVLSFNGDDNQGWTISNIRFLDFDLSIGMFNGPGGTDAHNNTHITNNYIRIARDLNTVVAPADVNQNIGIHFSFGTNQLISGNTIEIQGDGISSGSNFATDVGMQSNTSGGNVYDGLQVTNNVVRVLNAQNAANPQVILGIWENAHGHTSNITVSGNQFINLAAGNNPAINLQRGFRVTSHSSATTTVTYQSNTVTGANIGFQWISGSAFAGNQPVKLISNTITGNGTGVLLQSQGLANLSFNRIVGNTVTGLNNVDGTVTAENNWWGCNAGPGSAGCDTTTGTVDSNPWMVLGISATPTSMLPGGTSTITADLTKNSDGLVPVGTLPNIPVAWSATNGTMTPPTGTITAGTATSMFTSTSGSNGSAAATVDNQTVNTPITVTAPTFAIDDVSHNEGNTGTTAYTFTVTKSGSTGLSASVQFQTVDGSATVADSDYQANSGTLNFAAGDTTKQFTVLVTGDNKFETNEAFTAHLSSAVNATISDADGTGSIQNDDATPSLSINDVTANEGNAGASTFTFTVTLSNPSSQTVTVNFATAPGTATAASDYGTNSGTLTFNPLETSKPISVTVSGDTANEPNETFFVNLSTPVNATISDGQGLGTITNDDTPRFRFEQAGYEVFEASGFVEITVQRTGDLTSAVAVDYASSDMSATEHKDYTTAFGTLRFAAGQDTLKFNVMIEADSFTEGAELFALTLSNPTGGSVLGIPANATVQIDDSPSPAPNALDNARNFVRRHYHDFLNREPDTAGSDFWTNEITSCGNDTACIQNKRVFVSAAFFLSIEFQESGLFAIRSQRVAFNRRSDTSGTRMTYNEFMRDSRQIGDGVVVPDTVRLEQNKQAYALQVVTSSAFTTRFTQNNAADYVDALYASAGVTPVGSERQQAIDAYNAAVGGTTEKRVAGFRKVTDSGSVRDAEFRAAFVLMEYLGYLRRDPDNAGYNFWLAKLNQFNGNFVDSDMVKSFIVSGEYRDRFTP